MTNQSTIKKKKKNASKSEQLSMKQHMWYQTTIVCHIVIEESM